MKEQLQSGLVQALTTLITELKGGVDFAKEHLPDVVQQLILYKTVTLGIALLACAAVAVLLAVASQAAWRLMKCIPESDRDRHFERSSAEGRMFAAGGAAVGLCLIAAPLALDFLKVVLAPKVYLLEYAASMLK